MSTPQFLVFATIFGSINIISDISTGKPFNWIFNPLDIKCPKKRLPLETYSLVITTLSSVESGVTVLTRKSHHRDFNTIFNVSSVKTPALKTTIGGLTSSLDSATNL